MPTMTKQEAAAKARAGKDRKYAERLAEKLRERGWVCEPPKETTEVPK